MFLFYILNLFAKVRSIKYAVTDVGQGSCLVLVTIQIMACRIWVNDAGSN